MGYGPVPIHAFDFRLFGLGGVLFSRHGSCAEVLLLFLLPKSVKVTRCNRLCFLPCQSLPYGLAMALASRCEEEDAWFALVLSTLL